MMKKTDHSSSIEVTVLLMVGGMFILSTAMEVYGQEQLQQQQRPTSPSPSLSTGQTTTEGWITSFDLENCDFVSSGENSYFILKPGYQVILGGQEDREELELVMTVLNETKVVDGIETRVVEEKEAEGGNIVEVSRNYFAICKPTNNAIYFGEEVDMYKDGKIVNHEGAWLAGENGSKAKMIMPGKADVCLKYYQEIALGVAEDRAERPTKASPITTIRSTTIPTIAKTKGQTVLVLGPETPQTSRHQNKRRLLL